MNNIVKGLEKFKKRVESDVKKGVKEFVELQHTQASDRVPVDSSELLNSIEKNVDGYKGHVSVNAIHAIYVEFGTGIYATGTGGSRAKKIPWVYEKDGKFYTTYGMPAQPYWYPSLHISRDYFHSYFNRK
ncbi:HK97 gp10 family phage protein [Macrococcus animalis]|uniref:HK97 gp10 family phage protein n=1 Tax=Macrococcus animalis TaxID=3395467 RepID=UPI0039BE452E